MKTVLIILSIFCINILSLSYDSNYTVEYALKDAGGTVLSKMKLYRNGTKMKFVKIDNSGKPNETTTDIFILKDENQVYSVVTNSAGKFGSRKVMDIMYVFMQTGVYIFDLGNDGKIFNSNSRNGSGTVLGMDCTKYTVASNGEASSDYYIYQDNLMLRRSVGSASEGNTIEALSYDNTTPVPESLFVIPSDVIYY